MNRRNFILTIGRRGFRRRRFLFVHPSLKLIIIDGDSLVDEGIEVGGTTDDGHGFLDVQFQLIVEEETLGVVVEI